MVLDHPNQLRADIEKGGHRASDRQAKYVPLGLPHRTWGSKLRRGSFVLYLLALPFLVPITVVSFGAPYWYFRCYSLRRQGGEGDRGRAWKTVFQQIQRQWKIYHTLSLIVVPAAFKVYVVPTLERCSVALILSTVALLSTMMQLAVTTIYKEYTETLQRPTVVANWVEVSSGKWYSQDAVVFWVFLSTPAVWFSCSIVTSLLSVVLPIWTENHADPVVTPLFRGTITAVAVTALMNMEFIVSTLQSFDLDERN